MDLDTICQVVAWIKARQDREELFDDDTPPYGPITGTPTEIYLQFLAHPQVISSDDPNKTSFVRGENGCTFTHYMGAHKGMQCGESKNPGSDPCQYHGQVIFSEKVQKAIRDTHEMINRAFEAKGPALIED